MKFYDRKREIEILQEIEELSSEYAQMTMMVGRRRIGKTTLLKNAFVKTPVLYFFVGRKNEVLLCEEFVNEVEIKLHETLGQFTSFSQLFKVIMQLSKRLNFTLIIDEFHYQNFYEFPKFRIKLLILILLHFNIVRIIY